jgi:phage terminase small subunit
MKNNLSSQEQNFIKEVVKTGNVTQSVKKAFDEKSDNYAGVKGHRLIRKDKIQSTIQPIVNKWIEIRDKLTKELEKKDLTKESMRDITDTLDKINKNIQLLSGGATENINIKPLATLEDLKQDVRKDDSNEQNSQSL